MNNLLLFRGGLKDETQQLPYVLRIALQGRYSRTKEFAEIKYAELFHPVALVNMSFDIGR